jgi:pre-mRNA-splicing factor RBM22/SLT11
MLDLSFGLPIVVRDAALKMVAPGPQSAVNREYYAQNNEAEIAEGRGVLQEYKKTDEKARELLQRLANSKPYFRKQRSIATSEENQDTDANASLNGGPGPIRTNGMRRGNLATTSGDGAGRSHGQARGMRAFPSVTALPPRQEDITPPNDPTIMSLFLTGVEDDLPEFKIREFFNKFGKLRSIVCSHMSHCAFVNYTTRQSAEAAAEALQGRTVIAGCPLRVQWGKPRPIGTMEKDERIATGREGRHAFAVPKASAVNGQIQGQGESAPHAPNEDIARMSAIAPPPGAADVEYTSLNGN